MAPPKVYSKACLYLRCKWYSASPESPITTMSPGIDISTVVVLVVAGRGVVVVMVVGGAVDGSGVLGGPVYIGGIMM